MGFRIPRPAAPARPPIAMRASLIVSPRAQNDRDAHERHA
jgi:hypothetical protein